MTRVLLVDDDVELLDMLTDYLVEEGYIVDNAHDGPAGVAAALSGRYAIAVLDVMMPGLNGLDVLRAIRSRSQMPVLMLTARGDDTDRIIGLELGADDYLPKPCNPRELNARIKAILRRSQGAPAAVADPAIKVGDLTLWPGQRLVQRKDVPLELTSTEFNLLEVLARHAGQAVSRADLSALALGRPLARFDRNVDVHLSSLRHKVGKLEDGRFCIQTVYRQGYQLIWE
jgi:two-component system OmpR family response regulator